MQELSQLIAKQRGFSMFITLIVLVPMMIAGVALTRSVDTAGVIMGNVAFKQSAVLEADSGVEQAISWLQKNKNNPTLLNEVVPANGYSAVGYPNPIFDLSSYQNYVEMDGITPCESSSNTNSLYICYAIRRLCPPVSSDCMVHKEPIVGCSLKRKEDCFLTAYYYLITVRVVGPSSAASYVQVIISMGE